MKHLTKFRSLLGLIYAFIMLLPISSVAFRCFYTVFNKNAFESYYGETINERQLEQIDYSNLQINNEYIFNNELITPTTTEIRTKLNVNSVINLGTNTNYSNIRFLEFFMYPNDNATRAVLWLKNASDTVQYTFELHQNSVSIQFLLEGVSNTQTLQYFNYFYKYEYNKYSYLDNAWEYSLYTFVQNHSRGQLNLTDWFTNVFLDSSSSHNMLYLDFVNWYMNYTLLVSCVYLLYLVLMWFVSLARRLLTGMIEKGGNVL